MDIPHAATEPRHARVDALTAVCLVGIGVLVGLACSEWWPVGQTGSRGGVEVSVGMESAPVAPKS